MSARGSLRPMPALGVILVASLFIAGPTPGDIGGCGGDAANTTLPGDRAEQEFDYFDQGLCANMCLRLRTCGYLCAGIGNPPGCVNDSLPAFQQCVRGTINGQIFGQNTCPNSCSNYQLRYGGASEQDVIACGNAVRALSCEALADVVRTPPNECLAVCGGGQ